MNNAEMGRFQKILVTEGASFSQEVETIFREGSAGTRVSSVKPGAGDILGLDQLLSQKLSEIASLEQDSSVKAAVLDREYVAKLLLDSIFMYYDCLPVTMFESFGVNLHYSHSQSHPYCGHEPSAANH